MKNAQSLQTLKRQNFRHALAQSHCLSVGVFCVDYFCECTIPSRLPNHRLPKHCNDEPTCRTQRPAEKLPGNSTSVIVDSELKGGKGDGAGCPDAWSTDCDAVDGCPCARPWRLRRGGGTRGRCARPQRRAASVSESRLTLSGTLHHLALDGQDHDDAGPENQRPHESQRRGHGRTRPVDQRASEKPRRQLCCSRRRPAKPSAACGKTDFHGPNPSERSLTAPRPSSRCRSRRPGILGGAESADDIDSHAF